MPKKINKWRELDRYYTDEFHDKWVNSLGNMVLLSKKINIKIKNSPFSDKKKEYTESIFDLIKEIQACDEWKEKEIQKNLERYYKVTESIWN